MPPRKKLKSLASKSSKVSSADHSSQPSKFGIQQLFLRHFQNSQSTSSSPSSSIASGNEVLAPQNPPDMLDRQADNVEESSPEVSKTFKHFKFSPGTLIMQSQDDGNEEITWKISPMNEKLRATAKQIPKMAELSDNPTRVNSSGIRHCSLDKKVYPTPGTTSKLEQWLSSPAKKDSERSSFLVNSIVVERAKPSVDVDYDHVSTSANGSSPFQTPPSLSCCHNKVPSTITCSRVSELVDVSQHKKALLEILNQVEDVISVDGTTIDDEGSHVPQVEVTDRNVSSDVVHPQDGGKSNRLKKHTSMFADIYFLVLEVSEKRGSAGSYRGQCHYKVLRLLNENTAAERALYLWDEWFYSTVSPGDSINVIGKFDEEGKCNVDHENNFVIVHPNILIAGTKVAASFACPRRSVLDERLRSNEYSMAAMIGTLLHQVFQAGLRKESVTVDFLEEYASMVIKQNIESLYACGANERDVKATLFEAIPKMLKWIHTFRYSKDSRGSSVDFGSTNGQSRLKISEVVDIEEMAWAPKYGLKGMIDASVRVLVESDMNTMNEKIMPLEFKTGKVHAGQSSMEHCAQVILYTLLMSERYLKHIDNGLLYYLQADQTHGIAVQRSDLVGLIMRRNELANDILKASKTQQFPPMLRNLNMCQGCRHLDSCTIYHKVHGGNKESSGLGDVFDMLTSNLSTVHCNFLRLWDRLIDLEAREMQVNSHGPKSSNSASYLSSMVLDVPDGFQHLNYHKENRFIYRFVHQSSSQTKERISNEDSKSTGSPQADELDCRFRAGDRVILSSEVRHLAVASGTVMDISRFHVSVSLSKQLRLPWSNPSAEVSDLCHEVWRIEKDEIMSSFSVMRSNLLRLFVHNGQSARLRKMIVDLEPPRFDNGSILSQDPAISYIWSEKSLNNDQRQAILKILSAKDYALILGMPGTGKTSTMVQAVKALLVRGSSILLASYTNSAVDNLLIKLKAQGIDFLRIGRHDAIHKEVRDSRFSGMEMCSVDDVRTKLDQVQVVATTCLGINSPLLVNKQFDVCIVDEAGQIALPVSLGPLMFASKFVLVGDHYQLPPLVQSAEARENGMGISLFRRLSEAHPQAISVLHSQYRMSQGIMELSNALIYGDRLCCGSSEVANAKLELSTSKFCPSWLKEVLEPRRTVVFVNTDTLPAFEARDHNAIYNPVEASLIAKIAEELVSNGVSENEIGIITPYNSQASLIQQAIPTTSVEIHTIDKYQGRDKDCIMVSFVRSSQKPSSSASSLLGDWHRINVALTRAKKKLIMVGSRRTLSRVPLLMLLLRKVDEQSNIVTITSHQEIR
ncbi:PREDICTED: DNA replication ATP-dependent helicase/nuclease DNA2-like [Tarenaya hassleriana]|uniref:DNA replication ATP-dependent helicase/nuclease DNA2-like n=1 Tax=Tarenaya hassleriana TaxID=28532 RepID=UPI00053C9599|nr:PREDICTED: DNA replication ATP-dependent helicase/nuclease DNA2-like [Tarenaya hassleriana]